MECLPRFQLQMRSVGGNVHVLVCEPWTVCRVVAVRVDAAVTAHALMDIMELGFGGRLVTEHGVGVRHIVVGMDMGADTVGVTQSIVGVVAVVSGGGGGVDRVGNLCFDGGQGVIVRVGGQHGLRVDDGNAAIEVMVMLRGRSVHSWILVEALHVMEAQRGRERENMVRSLQSIQCLDLHQSGHSEGGYS